MIKLKVDKNRIIINTDNISNSSLSNKDILKLVMQNINKKINTLIINSEFFSRVYNISLLQGINSLDPVNDFIKGKKELKEFPIIKKAIPFIKKGLNSSMIYNKLFVPEIKPLFIKSRIIKINGRLLKSYLIGNSSVSIIKNKNGQFYCINPPELSFNHDFLKKIANTIKEIKELNFDLDNFRSNVLDFIKRRELSDDVKESIIRHTIGFGLLDIIFKDELVQDTFIYSYNKSVNINHAIFGECRTNIILSDEDIKAIGTKIRVISGRPFDSSFPVIDYDLTDYNIRVCGVREPLTFDGIGYAFRKHRSVPWVLSDFIKNKMISSDVAGLLNFLVDGQASILITGPRGSGKTSLLSALINEIPVSQRIIIIEDTPELPVKQLVESGFRIQHLRIKQLTNSNDYELSAEEALRTALRLGESVLVIGEVRGSEAKALFEAMRVGAAGNVVLGTIHGSNAFDTFDRIVNDLGVPPTSFKATDIVISCASLRRGESFISDRRVVGVTEVKKDWVDMPVFSDLTVFKNRTLSLASSINKSFIIDKISSLKGLSVKECLRSIKLRGKAKELIIKEKVPVNPLINSFINQKISELLSKDKTNFLKEFRKYLSSFNKNFSRTV